MIDAALSLLAGQLNQHLRGSFDLTEDLVVLSNLHEQNGALVPLVANKVVLFLTGIERETAIIERTLQPIWYQRLTIPIDLPRDLNLAP